MVRTRALLDVHTGGLRSIIPCFPPKVNRSSIKGGLTLHNGTVFNRWTRCPECGTEAAYNRLSAECTISSCKLYFARHTHGERDTEQVEGGDFVA